MKPTTRDGYDKVFGLKVQAACLHLLTFVGDLKDELVIVGGLVPTLLTQNQQVEEVHVGTMDLDVGLSVAVLTEERYEALAQRLTRAGFAPDSNAKGNLTRHRWNHQLSGVKVDFLIQTSTDAGKLQNMTASLAAIQVDAIELAFLDRVEVELSGETLNHDKATRRLWVCGPSAFVAMKAIAFGNRNEPKDAYDLVYVLRECQPRPSSALCTHTVFRNALERLASDFATLDSHGCKRAASFLGNESDELLADIVGMVADYIQKAG